MISIKALHGADAWRYLMESVTDGQGDLRDPLRSPATSPTPGPHRDGGLVPGWPAWPRVPGCRSVRR